MCHPIKCIFHLLRPLKTHASIGETSWILISDIRDGLLRKQIFTITKVIRPLPTIQHTVLSQKHRVDKLIVVSKAIYTPQFFSFNCHRAWHGNYRWQFIINDIVLFSFCSKD